MNKIAKQLRREVRTNPKKAVVLGLVGAVAVWFWVPLLASWIAPEDPAAAGVAAASPLATPPATSLAVPATPSGGSAANDAGQEKDRRPRHPWQRLVQWMDDDPRTLAINVPSNRRDPFEVPQSQVVEAPLEDDPEKVPEPPQLDLTPESLGMVLSSTMTGPGNSGVARINGKLYRQGKPVTLHNDGQQIVFLLTEVHSRHVVLSRDEEQFELKIPAPARAGRVEAFIEGN